MRKTVVCGDGMTRTGELKWHHPDGIFDVMEFTGLLGAKWREAVYCHYIADPADECDDTESLDPIKQWKKGTRWEPWEVEQARKSPLDSRALSKIMCRTAVAINEIRSPKNHRHR